MIDIAGQICNILKFYNNSYQDDLISQFLISLIDNQFINIIKIMDYEMLFVDDIFNSVREARILTIMCIGFI